MEDSPAVPPCYRCQMEVAAEMEYCPHCGARVGAREPVPRWHLHRRLYDWTLAWAYRPSATIALFLMSFAESSFFPVPPDVLLMPLCMGNRRKWLRYATLCTLASVLGGIAGYAIGYYVWQSIQDWAYANLGMIGITAHNYEVASTWFETYGFWVVFVAGLTPIPYKVITISAGASVINFPVFVVASVIGRGMRFYAVAGLVRLFGPKVTPFIEKYFNWLSLAFVALLIGGFAAMKLFH